jgi:hypothetical protein
MKSLRLYLLACALAAGCASTPPNLNDDLVVRGKRIGDVELGMPLASLLTVKGAPLRTAPISGTNATTYTFANGLTVGADDKVYWIIAEDARYHTAEGVRPGAEQIFARATLGKPRCVETRAETTVYDYGDVYFEIDNLDGRVERVGVISQPRACPTPG